jgi:hypothetical protein
MAEPAMKLSREDDVEVRFRSALQDVLETTRKLAPYFNSVDDLVDSLELALVSDGQLRLLMNKVLPRQKR